jgi:anti-sigma-K factor RskA
MDCDDLAEVATELALGVLTGRERAHAIVHLDRCDACREHVRNLAVTEEELLALLPGHEPPAGFETRVIGRLGSGRGGSAGRHRRRPSRRPRWMLAVAAAAIAVVAGVGGWALRPAAPGTAGRPAQSALHTAALVTASHQSVGQVFLDSGDGTPWLYMTVDTAPGAGAVVCQVVGRDGRIMTIGSFWPAGGHGHWGSPEPIQPGALTGVRLTTAAGQVLATARFGAAKLPAGDGQAPGGGTATPAMSTSATASAWIRMWSGLG